MNFSCCSAFVLPGPVLFANLGSSQRFTEPERDAKAPRGGRGTGALRGDGNGLLRTAGRDQKALGLGETKTVFGSMRAAIDRKVERGSLGWSQDRSRRLQLVARPDATVAWVRKGVCDSFGGLQNQTKWQEFSRERLQLNRDTSGCTRSGRRQGVSAMALCMDRV